MKVTKTQDPTPELEENEFMKCFSVPLASLYAEYIRLEEQGYAIDARVNTLVEGSQVARC